MQLGQVLALEIAQGALSGRRHCGCWAIERAFTYSPCTAGLDCRGQL